MDDDGELAAAGPAASVEKSAEGAAAVDSKSPGPSPARPAAVSGPTPDTDSVGADVVGGEISSSRDQQGIGPAVGEQKRRRAFGGGGVEGFGCALECRA